MRTKSTVAYLSLASVLAVLMSVGAPAKAASVGGQVSSAEEGTMEGVLVSAKKEGSTITTTVVTNDKGQFSFPADKLEPGKYTITIRAAGYTLVGPEDRGRPASRRDGRHQARQDRRMSSSQLSNARVAASACRATTGSRSFLPDCAGLPYAAARVHRRRIRADEWEQVFTRMGRYAPESTPTHPQLHRDRRPAQRAPARARPT